MTQSQSGPTTGVVVTGGASGIGRACAHALAAAGRPVALWDLDGGAVEALAKDLTAEHGVASIGLAVDLGDLDAHADAIARTCTALGGIGGLVHSAGTVDSTPINDVTVANWDRVVDVNLRSYAFLVQALVPHLREHAGSAIVGIASINAVVGNAANPSYCASKAGLLGLNRSLAAQLGRDGIRVNAVCPGYIETPMLSQAFARPGARERLEASSALGRLGRPEEIAGAVRFLMGDDASFVTGEHLMVDGAVTSTV